MPIAPSTYYAARHRAPSARAVRDEQVSAEIARVHRENYGVYGYRKVHAQLAGEQVVVAGRPVARCTVARLMRAAGLCGISRAKGPRTTISGTRPDTRPDLVERDFTAAGPDRLWVADITYVRSFTGWVYCAFVLDVFSRRVMGWQVSTSLRTDLALDALQMGLWTRRRDGHDTTELVHHSDRGVQGGFNWSSQHLDREVERWVLWPGRSVCRPIAGRLSRPGDRRWRGARTGSGSGPRSRRARRPRTRARRPACRGRSGSGGFATLAG